MLVCLKMADDKKNEIPESPNQESSESRSLEDFVTDHYHKQKGEGNFDATPEIDDERTLNFFSRAINESRRMNAEVEKSNSKLSKLEAEFGVEMMTAWKTEHAAEVLTPQQMKQLGINDQS